MRYVKFTQFPPNMKFFCCYTKGHEALFLDYFKPSLPCGIELMPTLLPVSGAGDFLSSEFLECIARKVDLIMKSLRNHSGEIIVWSDIDIIFFKPVVPELQRLLEESGKEILVQREGKNVADVNSGFFVCKSSPRLIAFFEKVRAALLANPRTNEQYAINELLCGDCMIDFGYLPLSYYARTHGWPPSQDIALYHANATPGANGVEQKIRQFKELRWIRQYGPVAVAWSSMTKVPKRMARLVRECFGL